MRTCLVISLLLLFAFCFREAKTRLARSIPPAVAIDAVLDSLDGIETIHRAEEKETVIQLSPGVFITNHIIIDLANSTWVYRTDRYKAYHGQLDINIFRQQCKATTQTVEIKFVNRRREN